VVTSGIVDAWLTRQSLHVDMHVRGRVGSGRPDPPMPRMLSVILHSISIADMNISVAILNTTKIQRSFTCKTRGILIFTAQHIKEGVGRDVGSLGEPHDQVHEHFCESFFLGDHHPRIPACYHLAR
jgi:hypothetical protein